MVRVSIKVRNGAVHFDVVVQAESICRAVSLVGVRYPKSDVRVKFPIDPESFFMEDPTARTGILGFAQPDAIAA
jgi:hypothetical protein